MRFRCEQGLTNPLENFISCELNAARKMKQEFRTTQLQLQGHEKALQEFKASSSSHKRPSELVQLDLTYWTQVLKTHQRKESSDLALHTVLSRKEFDVASYLLSLLRAEQDLNHIAAKELANSEKTAKDAVEFAKKHRPENWSAREKRAVSYLNMKWDRYNTRWHGFVTMLSSEDLVLVQSICSTAGADSDKLLETVVRVLDAYHETLPIIKVGITKEVQATTSDGSLFRGNSPATKLMSAFTRLTGRPYLHALLKDLIDEIMANPSGYEVDPSKTKDNIDSNMQKLLSTSERALNLIINSIDQCPSPFRYMASYLRQEVCKKFPDAKHTSVGGFLFLRFFCPAILSPDSCGLATNISKEARRPLILIAK